MQSDLLIVGAGAKAAAIAAKVDAMNGLGLGRADGDDRRENRARRLLARAATG